FSASLVDQTLADQAREVAALATFGPPVAVLAFVLGAIVHVGVLGRQLDEGAREWYASLCGWLMIYAAAWAAVFAVSFFSVPFLIWVGPWVKAALAAGWVGTAAAGVLAGRSPQTGAGGRTGLREILALVAPYAFLVGLLVAVAALVSWVVDTPPSREVAKQMVPPRPTPAAEAPTPWPVA